MLDLNIEDILSTERMFDQNKLDVRTVTMGISLLGCISDDEKMLCTKIYDTICRKAEHLTSVSHDISREYGVPIINRRISVTPIALIAGGIKSSSYVSIARTLQKAADAVGVDILGGFSALVDRGMSASDKILIDSIPEALATTKSICSSVSVGSTKAGINMDAVKIMGHIIKETAELTKNQDAYGCTKLVEFCNPVEDNPFMAGAFHGVGEPECTLNIGVSGPGVVLNSVQQHPEMNLGELSNVIKKTAFKITRMGQLVGALASQRLGVPFGIVDLSLAPTPAIGDSVARILEEVGLEVCGGCGTTAILAMLNDAVKKGGDRQALHEKIREYSMIAGKHVKEDGLENDLCDMILADPMFMITKEELDAILQPENFTGRSEQQTEEFVDNCIRPILAANASLIGEHYEMKN